ncbi:MAG TPA: NAD(P)-dependent oxidoreductase [Cyclobacteriaceae bacterium]|nr:NAD(P)-dependent oxidoreductase [Cyclobacteriaceae bacterium]
MTRVALFGRTGFIGSRVADHLKDGSIPFTGISTSTSGADTIKVDLSDLSSFKSIPGDVDCAIICSAKLPQRSYGPGDIREFIDANVQSVVNVLHWASQSSIRRIVYCSTLSMIPAHSEINSESMLVDTRSHYPYKISKAMAEHLVAGFCSERKIEFMILRIASVYGPGMKPDVIKTIIEAAINNGSFTLSNKNATADFVHVNDVAAAVVASLSASPANRIISVSSGIQLPLAELCKIVSPDLNIVIQSDTPVSTRVHSDKEFRKLIGREPKNIRDGMREMINYYRT